MPQVRWAQVQGAEGKSASRLPHRRVQTQDTNNGHGHGAGRASISDTLGTETGVPELQCYLLPVSETRSLESRVCKSELSGGGKEDTTLVRLR